ncbi:MAG: hypothetical protein HC836_49515 [Richelia sp. RM2_1_2]|nr:hypothetical protein [Richelia sp. RM2_1_2]
MIKDMSAEEEGFVAYDGKTRVKIKNPAYLIKHKSETNFTQKDIFQIIKENEKDEFIGIIDRYKELYLKAEHFWMTLVIEGYKIRDKSQEICKKSKDKKDFALEIKNYFTKMNSFFQGIIFK